MAERDIILESTATPSGLHSLREYLRELYRLLDNRFITITRAASVIFNVDEGEIFYVELDGNITGITLQNADYGRKITLIFKQDSTGSRTVAGFDSNVMLAGNAFSVTANANRYTTLTLAYDGTNWVETGRTSDVY